MPERMRTPRSIPSTSSGQVSLALSRRRTACVLGATILLLAPAASTLTAQAPPAPASRFVVVLDAAHGGDDPGARLGGQSEKAYTLALSVRLRSLLVARGFAVVTTRESDAAMDADQRAAIADHSNPQACLSLHAAIVSSSSGSGVHLFVSSLAPAGARPLLPWKTAQAAWITRSLALAGVLNSAVSHAGMTVTLGQTALPALDSMTCPAVAVEVALKQASNGQGDAVGSGSSDDPDYQARVAKALAAALVEWRSGGGQMGVGQQ